MKLIILGDSVTVGAPFGGVSEDQGYADQLRRHLLRDRVEVVASALDGLDSSYALRRFDRMVASQRPDVVWVHLGLNDAMPAGCRPMTPPDQFLGNLRELVQKIRLLPADPVLVTPNPRGKPGEQIDVMEPYVDAMRHAASLECVHLIDVYDRFRTICEWWSFLPDGVHPNSQGHELIASVMLDYWFKEGVRGMVETLTAP